MRTGTELPFRNFSKRLFPKREEMADYLTAFHAAFLQDSVQFGFEVSEGASEPGSGQGPSSPGAGGSDSEAGRAGPAGMVK